MNNFNFTGNLGKDAEVKYLQSGTAICEFSVAVKSGYGDKEKTNWVRCAMFGKRAEGGLPPYLKKGTQVAISGELELQEWENDKGKGSALSVKVENIDLIGGNANQGHQANQQQNDNHYQQQSAPQPQGGAHNQGGFMPQQQGNFAPQQQGGGFAPTPQQPQGGYIPQGQQ